MSSGLPTPEVLDECYEAAGNCLYAIWFASSVCGEHYGELSESPDLALSYEHLADQYDDASIMLVNASREAWRVITWERENFIGIANGCEQARYRLHLPESLARQGETCEFRTLHAAVCQLTHWMANFFDWHVQSAGDFRDGMYFLSSHTVIPASEHRDEIVEEFARDFPGWNCDIRSLLLSEHQRAQLVLRSGNLSAPVQHQMESLTGASSIQEFGPPAEITAIRADVSKKNRSAQPIPWHTYQTTR